MARHGSRVEGRGFGDTEEDCATGKHRLSTGRNQMRPVGARRIRLSVSHSSKQFWQSATMPLRRLLAGASPNVFPAGFHQLLESPAGFRPGDVGQRNIAGAAALAGVFARVGCRSRLGPCRGFRRCRCVFRRWRTCLVRRKRFAYRLPCPCRYSSRGRRAYRPTADCRLGGRQARLHADAQHRAAEGRGGESLKIAAIHFRSLHDVARFLSKM